MLNHIARRASSALLLAVDAGASRSRFLRRVLVDNQGEPKPWSRRILFHRNGDPRGPFEHWQFPSDPYRGGRRIRFGRRELPKALTNTAAATAFRKLNEAVATGLLAEDPKLASFLPDYQALLSGIANAFASGTPTLVFSGVIPFFSNGNDGYMQRVVAIDRVLAPGSRFYVSFSNAWTDRPRLIAMGGGFFLLEVAEEDTLGRILLSALAEAGTAIYAHALYGLRTGPIEAVVSKRTGPFLLDLHGCVPEEHLASGDPQGAESLRCIEDRIAPYVDYVVCVSNPMYRYFHDRHPEQAFQAILCPIFALGGISRKQSARFSRRPRVVYAGGTQTWQQVDKIIEFVLAHRRIADFVLLTPDPSRFIEGLVQRGYPHPIAGIDIRSATHDEVFSVYRESNFGVIFRDTSVINKISCPTKLIEYLQFGLVPILQSAEMGDFRELGMRYLPEAEFGRVEDFSTEFIESVSLNNYKVVETLAQISIQGQEKIGRIVKNSCRSRANAAS